MLITPKLRPRNLLRIPLINQRFFYFAPHKLIKRQVRHDDNFNIPWIYCRDLEIISSPWWGGGVESSIINRQIVFKLATILHFLSPWPAKLLKRWFGPSTDSSFDVARYPHSQPLPFREKGYWTSPGFSSCESVNDHDKRVNS